jgi:DHA2 family multidrug resistance protein
MALAGIYAFVSETEKDKERPFDLFGFALLSLAIGTFQLMLDRGQSNDWFSSPETVTEALLVVTFTYLFLVHMFTAKRPFIEPGLFRDRNFALGMFFIFIIGIILLATLALLPPFLQGLMGYPVLDTGYVLAPRGVGTMISMIMVGRLSGKVDPRAMIVTGLLLTSLSLWDMARFTTDVSMFTLIYTGVVQGLGLGLIFVPLSTITFATLAQHYRNEGTAMFSLLRNLGSSIGISWMMTLLSRNAQTNHAALAEHLTPFNNALESVKAWDPSTVHGMAALNGEVTRQALTIAYLQDFRIMMWVTLLALPLVFLLRGPQRTPAPA